MPQPHDIANNDLMRRAEWLDHTAKAHQFGEFTVANFIAPLTVRELSKDDRFSAVVVVHELVGELGESDPRAIAFAERVENLIQAGYSITLSAPNADEDEKDLHAEIMNDPLVASILDERELTAEQKELELIWPRFVEVYSDGLNRGVQLGYIPENRQYFFVQAARKTAVRVVDGYVLQLASPGMKAYYDSKDEIGLSHLVIGQKEEIEVHLAHEFTHQISGGTFIKTDSPEGELLRPRIGHGTHTKPDQLKRENFTEFLTHHSTLGILTGDFTTFDPDKRADGDDTYYAVRKVGAAFVDKAAGVIDPKVLIRSLFEDSGPGGSSSNRRQMLRQVRQAYGKGALRNLDRLFEFGIEVSTIKWSTPVAKKMEELVTSRIHPPKLDKDGRIIAQGYIDSENLPDFSELMKMQKADEDNIV